MSTTTFIGQSIVNITLLTSFFATLIAFLFEFQFKLHFWWLSGAILIFNYTMPIVFRGSFAEDQSKLKVFILFLCCYALVEKALYGSVFITDLSMSPVVYFLSIWITPFIVVFLGYWLGLYTFLTQDMAKMGLLNSFMIYLVTILNAVGFNIPMPPTLAIPTMTPPSSTLLLTATSPATPSEPPNSSCESLPPPYYLMSHLHQESRPPYKLSKNAQSDI